MHERDRQTDHGTVTWRFCVYRDADELLGEKEKYKTISEDLDFTFTELAGF